MSALDHPAAVAAAVGAPDPALVIACTPGGPGGTTVFVYGDGRAWVLEGIKEVEAE